MDDIPSQLLVELNLDDTNENKTTLTAKFKEAWAIIKDSIDNKADDDELAKDKIFVAAVKSLTAQLFYDRTLSGGISVGTQMMINHLVGKVDQNGYQSD